MHPDYTHLPVFPHLHRFPLPPKMREKKMSNFFVVVYVLIGSMVKFLVTIPSPERMGLSPQVSGSRSHQLRRGGEPDSSLAPLDINMAWVWQ